VPTGQLASAEVWEALLEDMPMTALVRNLAAMTRASVLAPGSAGTAKVVAQLGNRDRIRIARVHLIALDVSGSMGMGCVAGVPGLTPRDASAALALVTAATETRYETVGFYTGLSPLAISPRQRLDDAIRTVSNLPFGGTDCALPMLYALEREREFDVFIVLTDAETWAGDVHPSRALADYRRASGIDARLVVVGMVSNGFSIADPNDPGQLDIVGFDTATPQLISDFARGAL
jgi:60 kDa SS-A/Ro ribonucleoprotein